jgi:hypothetical protein
MNKSVVYLAIFLIVVGLAFNFYLVSLIGLLFLLPGLAAPSRPPARLPTSTPKPPPRRVIPQQPYRQPAQQPSQQGSSVAATQPAQPMAAVAPAPPPQPQGYSAALFPAQMFPTLNPIIQPVQMAKEASIAKHEGKDELVEVGTMLALLKLVLG